jgi:hypothetical protein
MVRLTKTPLPDGVGINGREDWEEGAPARVLLDSDCRSKCYICEDKPDTLTVDHVRPRHSHPALERDWANLLLACEHCNGVKGSRYGGIFSPTERDPESEIKFAYQGGVNVAPRTGEADTLETVALLNAVYNAVGIDAGVKLRCARLSEKVRRALVEFKLYISHIDEPGYGDMVRGCIDAASPFAAFKRQIVREDDKLAEQFAVNL